MSYQTTPTVKVASEAAPGGFYLLNETDFDAETMSLFEDAAADPAASEPDDKADLLRQAGELGIKADGRWSVERLKAAIDEALKG